MFDRPLKIKISLFCIISLISVSFFIINWYLISQFRKQLNQQVQTIVNVYHDKLSKDQIDSKFLKDTIMPLISDLGVPIVITTKQTDGSVTYTTINSLYDNENIDSYEKIDKIKNLVFSMDQINEPLPLFYIDDVPIVEIHYGDPLIINSLRWLPFLQLSFAIILLLSVFFGLRLLLSNEKNFIYAGLSRETAHQLGTPISSLLGWLELIENKNKVDEKEIIGYMKSDITRLQNISDKFNKIGSQPSLNKIDIYNILYDNVSYFSKKLPKNSLNKITLNASEGLLVKGDKILLNWAVENIIKNSLDSLSKVKNGKLIIESYIDNNSWVHINFSDNGPGIERKYKTKIFTPGFSTKKRGWGIGLNLSKRIISQLHNGHLVLVKSNSSNTIFRISLKLSAS
tara:strand:+ start:1541 stop:2737 length:1197 start_codon:yes stop_codon:yes gene_type:complete